MSEHKVSKISPVAPDTLVEVVELKYETSGQQAGTVHKKIADNEASAAQALTDHEAAADPHSQYVTHAEGDAAYEEKRLNNLVATAAPTANDDNTQGYSPLSIWYVVSLDPPEAYRAISVATGAAKWELTTLTVEDLGALATADNAGDVPIADSGGHFAATDVEGALQEEAVARKAVDSARTAHESDTNNPHSVTAAQAAIVDAGGYYAGGDAEAGLQEAGSKNAAQDTRLDGLEGLTGIRPEAQYRANQAINRDRFAGSGFVERGKHYGLYVVEGGLWANQSVANRIVLGYNSGGVGGSSRTNHAQFNVNGALINAVLQPTIAEAKINFPPAPTAYVEATTTMSIAYKQGDFVVVGNDVYVFVADGQIGTVVNATAFAEARDAVSRKDLVFLEYWEELLTTKDIVYPNGAVQFGATTWSGIALTNTQVAASYSAFGAWESSPVAGYGLRWSTASAANKQAFINDPANNIFVNAAGQLVQGRFRIRTVAGFGDDFKGTLTGYSARSGAVGRYLGYGGEAPYFKAYPQGSAIAPLYDIVTGGGYPLFATPKSSTYAGADSRTGSNGAYYAVSDGGGNKITGEYGELIALPIALVQRRNQGAYHPVFNAEGTAWCRNTAGDSGSAQIWYGPTTYPYASVADTFTYASDNASYDGNIGDAAPARPDALYYDAIYARDVKDLRKSAKGSESFARTNKREFQKLIAGNQRGFEGAREIVEVVTATPNAKATQGAAIRLELTAYTLTEANSDGRLSTFDGSTFISLDGKPNGFVIDAAGNPFGISAWSVGASGGTLDVVELVHVHGTNTSVIDITTDCTFILLDKAKHQSETLMHCDIIGDPANYPADWNTYGVSGSPLVVAEDGTSLLPADVTATVGGTKKTFKASRKFIGNAKLVLAYSAGSYVSVPLSGSDGGWTSTAATNEYSLWSTDWVGGGSFDNNTVFMAFYETAANGLEVAAGNEVLHVGGLYSTNDGDESILGQHLVGKVPVFGNNQNGVHQALTGYRLFANGAFNTHISSLPNHSTLQLGVADSPAVKAIPYLTHENGVLYLQVLFKELIYDGVDYGDTGDFTVVDNISTATDDNAKTVLVGQKKYELPIYYKEDEQ